MLRGLAACASLLVFSCSQRDEPLKDGAPVTPSVVPSTPGSAESSAPSSGGLPSQTNGGAPSSAGGGSGAEPGGELGGQPTVPPNGAAGAGGTASGGAATAPGQSSAAGGNGGAAAPVEPTNTGGASAPDDTDPDTPSTPDAGAALDDLTEYLAEEPSSRDPIEEQPFAAVPLGRDEAARALELLWDDHEARIRRERAEENDAKSITLGDYTLRYAFTIFGDAPAEGRSLFLSLHGGGEADAATNDGQWENQQVLYEPEEGVYLSPRAPTNTWNMWHQDHIDPLFTRLIENLVVFEGVNPNRVYVMGYSAGGDGVYQLGPRMADSWAAAAMMAGHPNDAQPISLRNIGFAIHVGALDDAFERNAIAADWGSMLDALQQDDPEGYDHQVEVHAGKGHWMDLEDAVAVPWMAGFTRNPVPQRVLWLEDDVPHERFYWLRLSEADRATGVLVDASYDGQVVTVDAEELKGELEVMLSDAMLDLDAAVTVLSGEGEELFSGVVSRTIGDLARTLEERGDPSLVFSANVRVTLP